MPTAQDERCPLVTGDIDECIFPIDEAFVAEG